MTNIIMAPFSLMFEVTSIILAWIWTSFKNTFIPRNRKDIQGEIVLLTGAGSGIGRLMAYRFSELGAIVICTDVNKATCDETCNNIRGKKGKAYSFSLDVTDREKVYELAKTIRAEIGDVSILINNAGIVTGRHFMDCPDELMLKTMEVNAISHFWTLKAFLGPMIKRNHGHIVSIASLAGHIGSPQLIDYTASKFAAVGLMDSLRLELHKTAPNVHTTTVSPYFISTGMFQGTEVPKSILFKWSEPDETADEIVAGVLNNEADVFIPRYRTYIMLYLKALAPFEIQTKFCDFFGIHNVMKAFTGRHGKKE